jgi:AcrR family transcriptional regulator
MSRDRPTRTTILAATRSLLERDGYDAVSLERVAQAAGVSRQAVYLHFGSKAGLLLALVDHADQEEGLAEALRPIEEAGTAVEALDAFATFAGTYAPRIHAGAMAFDAARRTDQAAEQAWQDRMRMRRRLHRRLVERLQAEGRLAEGWTIEAATDFVWALTLPHLYQSLVEERGWSRRRYTELIRRVLAETLVAP